jgi:hypothetical protein
MTEAGDQRINALQHAGEPDCHHFRIIRPALTGFVVLFVP